MTLGEFREQTKELSDDLVLEFYSERYNDSTQPKLLEFDTEGYVEIVIDDNRWCLGQNPALEKIRAEIEEEQQHYEESYEASMDYTDGARERELRWVLNVIDKYKRKILPTESDKDFLKNVELPKHTNSLPSVDKTTKPYQVINVISLDKIKKAREDIQEEVFRPTLNEGYWYTADKVSECMAILDKLIGREVLKRKEWSHKPCINYKDGCEEWTGCPCKYYKAESEVENER